MITVDLRRFMDDADALGGVFANMLGGAGVDEVEFEV